MKTKLQRKNILHLYALRVPVTFWRTSTPADWRFGLVSFPFSFNISVCVIIILNTVVFSYGVAKEFESAVVNHMVKRRSRAT